MTVVPVVLAAGESRRMGSPKPFLRAGGSTFLERILESLRGAGLPDPIIVANPAHAAQYADAGVPAGRLVMNPRPADGMMSSLRLGLERVDISATHALVCLVDMPFVGTGTFAAVARAATENEGRIIVARHDGAEGHPVAWPRELFVELAGWQGPDGARGFLASRWHLVHPVDVADAQVLVDFDTPEALRSAGQEPGGTGSAGGASS